MRFQSSPHLAALPAEPGPIWNHCKSCRAVGRCRRQFGLRAFGRRLGFGLADRFPRGFGQGLSIGSQRFLAHACRGLPDRAYVGALDTRNIVD
jgi:hypothetical protein